MIREITENDVGALVEYGRYFWEQTPFVTTGMEYHEDSIADLLAELHLNHYLRVYELDKEIVGFIGLFVVPFMFNKNYKVSQECFFFVHPEHRGEIGNLLLQQAEEDLKNQGVCMMAMGDLMTSKDMNEYYTSLGYMHTENSFAKVL